MKLSLSFLALGIALLGMIACSGSPSFVRGSDNPDLDEFAMSTGLDKRDLEKLFNKNAKHLLSRGSKVMRAWAEATREAKMDPKKKKKRPTVAILPVRNETSEHIDSQLQALLSKFETQLINEAPVRVISYENQAAIVEEIKKQQSAAFDPKRAAQLGKQLGVSHFITGKVYNSDEKTGSERRVQYFLFMQAIEVETGEILWQNEANLTKGLIK